MIKYYILFIALCTTQLLQSQNNDVSEKDIELESLFIDAQLEKFKGNTESQIKILKTLIEKDRQSSAVLYELSQAYVDNQDFQNAYVYINKALKIESNNLDYLYQAALITSQTDVEKALTYVNKLKSLSNDERYYGLAIDLSKTLYNDTYLQAVLDYQKQFGKSAYTAEKLFNYYRVKSNIVEAEQTLQDIVTQYPHNIDYLANLARFQGEIGKAIESKENYSKILSLDPNHPEANLTMLQDSDEDSYPYLNLAQNNALTIEEKVRELSSKTSHLGNMSPPGELKSFVEAIDILKNSYPKEAIVFALEGDFLFNQGNYTDAMVAFQKAIDIKSNKYAVWESLMITQLYTSDYQKLAKSSNKAMMLFPLQFDPIFYNAFAKLNLDDSIDEQELIEEAKYMAGDDQLRTSKIAIIEGIGLMYDNKSEDAISMLKNFEELKEKNPLIFEVLGNAYHKINKQDKALEYWNKSVQYGNPSLRVKDKINS